MNTPADALEASLVSPEFLSAFGGLFVFVLIVFVAISWVRRAIAQL